MHIYTIGLAEYLSIISSVCVFTRAAQAGHPSHKIITSLLERWLCGRFGFFGILLTTWLFILKLACKFGIERCKDISSLIKSMSRWIPDIRLSWWTYWVAKTLIEDLVLPLLLLAGLLLVHPECARSTNCVLWFFLWFLLTSLSFEPRLDLTWQLPHRKNATLVLLLQVVEMCDIAVLVLEVQDRHRIPRFNAISG